MTDLRAVLGAVACGGAILLAACDDGQRVEQVYPTRGEGTSSSSSSSSGGASSSSSSGAPNGSSSGATVGQGKCPTVTVDTSCTLPADAEGTSYEDSWLTTDASCKTLAYVTNFDKILRRYELKSVSPCVFERDVAFGEIADVTWQVAADDAGNTYVANYDGTVKRVAPGAPITCTASSFTPPLPDNETRHREIAISRDGKVGYVAYGGNDGKSPAFGKITPTATGCEVTGLPLSGGDLVNAWSLAIDGKGRMQVADAEFIGGKQRVMVYDANGVFLSSYDQTPTGKVGRIDSIAPCLGGMCIDDGGDIVRVDDDGKPVAHERFSPEPIQTFRRIVGNAESGRLFSIGGRFTKVEDPPAISIWLLKNR